ncbi:MAG: cellulase family glycosylhydrolase [Flavobacteriaceae bacterium]|nr:cellulase family glycosylhydrolase [Flavobacteriaceae bacterium]
MIGLFFKIKINYIFLLLVAVNSYMSNAQLLFVDGKKIMNSANNEEIILNAMNFGNWMVMEGYMMNSANQAPDQHTWKNKLTNLIGSANTKTFYDAWLTNHVTQADINQVKAWGFNAVRVPLHYEYFVNSGSPDVWNNQGFDLLANLISWCTQAGIYVIIDLHAAPGGQSNGAISDYDNAKHIAMGK